MRMSVRTQDMTHKLKVLFLQKIELFPPLWTLLVTVQITKGISVTGLLLPPSQAGGKKPQADNKKNYPALTRLGYLHSALDACHSAAACHTKQHCASCMCADSDSRPWAGWCFTASGLWCRVHEDFLASHSQAAYQCTHVPLCTACSQQVLYWHTIQPMAQFCGHICEHYQLPLFNN